MFTPIYTSHICVLFAKKKKINECIAMFVDYYLLLGLPTGEEGMKLSEREVTKAFKAMALQVHPDKRPPDQAAAAHSDFQNLTAAYQTLMDAKKREEFNALLLAHIRWQQQQRQQQQQWRMIRIPRQMPNYEEERKKRQRVQEEEEERKKRQKVDREKKKKRKEIVLKLLAEIEKMLEEVKELEEEMASKVLAEIEKMLEKVKEFEAAAESKSRNAAKPKPSKAETPRTPGFQKFSNQDSLGRPPFANTLDP